MSASNPGLVRRFFRGVWRVVDVSRRVVLNLIFLLILALVVLALARSGPQPLAEKTALVLALDGSIAEQRAGNLRSTALDQLRGETTPQKMQLRDVLAVLDTAAKDDKIVSAVLILDELDATGLATLREIGAAVDRFRAKGKKVVAWGSSFDQRQYYIAAHADEVYLHPMGAVNVTGFGGVQNYYKDALDKVGVSVKVLRAGTFKDFGEAYVANAPSPEALEADSALLGSLWKIYTDEIEKLRKLPPGSVMKSIDEAPERLQAVGGDRAKLALADKAVDGLKTRDELRALMISRGVEDLEHKTFRQTSFDEYLARLRPRLTGDAIGVVVAEGEIVDGAGADRHDRRPVDRQPDPQGARRQGREGGGAARQLAGRQRLRLRAGAARARADARRRQAGGGVDGRPGGLGRLLDLDRVRRDHRRPEHRHRLDRRDRAAAQLLRHARQARRPLDAVATTWLRSAFDPRVPLDPRLADMIQRSVDHEYQSFIARVAQARKTTPDKIDGVPRAGSGRARRRSSAA